MSSSLLHFIFLTLCVCVITRKGAAVAEDPVAVLGGGVGATPIIESITFGARPRDCKHVLLDVGAGKGANILSFLGHHHKACALWAEIPTFANKLPKASEFCVYALEANAEHKDDLEDIKQRFAKEVKHLEITNGVAASTETGHADFHLQGGGDWDGNSLLPKGYYRCVAQPDDTFCQGIDTEYVDSVKVPTVRLVDWVISHRPTAGGNLVFLLDVELSEFQVLRDFVAHKIFCRLASEGTDLFMAVDWHDAGRYQMRQALQPLMSECIEELPHQLNDKTCSGGYFKYILNASTKNRLREGVASQTHGEL